jgi:hypothetical protein
MFDVRGLRFDVKSVLAPVVTPFKADLAPDSQRFSAQCKWLLSQNCGLRIGERGTEQIWQI